MQQNETASAENTSIVQLKLTTVTALAAAYMSHNQVHMDSIPALFSAFGAQVDQMLSPSPTKTTAEPEAPVPAVAVKKSVHNDYIISLFDGRKFKSLKRYLRTKHNMSPEEYRAYFGLPKDYPTVAPAYAKARSDLAKQMGLGQGGRIAQGKTGAVKTSEASSSTPAASAAKAPKAAAKPATKSASKTEPKSAPKAAAKPLKVKAAAPKSAPKASKAKAAETQAPATSTEGTTSTAA